MKFVEIRKDCFINPNHVQGVCAGEDNETRVLFGYGVSECSDFSIEETVEKIEKALNEKC